MHLNRRIKFQLAIFAVVTVAAVVIMALDYIRLPAMLFGAGRYTVTVELPESGGLYPSANVTYRGNEVGRVTSMQLTESGVEAVLSLEADIDIPSDLDAEVHSQSAIGEQYIALSPRQRSAPLKDGDVIPLSRSSVPPDINDLLDATNRGLEAIPQDSLKTVVDEASTALGGLGPEISRIVRGSTQLAIDAGRNLDPLTALIDQSQPVLDSQTETSDSIQAWAAHLATVTEQLRANDTAVTGLLQNGPAAADEARRLIDRLQPALPVLLANLVSTAKVAIAYQPALEQLLVLLPQGIDALQAGSVMNWDSDSPYAGLMLDFKLNTNMTHPCTTGFLPAAQIRSPVLTDAPDRAAGLYCRIPQDARQDVRGARNLPCLTVPGKRAPTVEMCESNEQYVPLNDGNNWKGDPNATPTGQDIPQLPPDTALPTGLPLPESPAAPAIPIAVAEYDPDTGSYVGPDGRTYTQTDLAPPKDQKTWQTMLTPPTGN